ncbi:MAG TPA: BON domain-containing protein [Verrucomicrobiae bacterium]|jgi:osmotically-inducible protein OsmY|nr:BON domain-containing protein [Verrucomicrobiae bacterium]
MRAFFNGLILGIIFGVLAYWYIQKKADEHPEAQQRYEQAASQSASNVTQAAESMSDAFRAKLATLDLDAGQIKDELSHGGEVVRHEAHDIGQAAVNAASDTRAVADIKAKYAMDHSLSAWKISVSCSQGHVKLSGTVSSPDDIGRAVALALEAPGVRDVTSTIQVQPKH